MEKQLLRTYGSGCARNLAFQILVMILAMGLFVVPAVIAILLGGDRDATTAIFIGLLILVVVAGVVGAAIWSVNRIRQRAAHLDAVFAPWDLTGEPYLRIGRKYHGEIEGHPVEVRFYRGPTLEFHITALLNTRAALLFKSEIGKFAASLGDYETVLSGDPLFHNLSIYALDARWMSEVLADAQARRAARQLMSVSSAYELRQVLIDPESLHLKLRRLPTEEITSENVQRWFDDLFTLLRAAKSVPKPQEITVAMPILSDQATEQHSRTLLFAVAGCSVLAGLAMCVAASAVAIAIFSNIFS